MEKGKIGVIRSKRITLKPSFWIARSIARHLSDPNHHDAIVMLYNHSKMMSKILYTFSFIMCICILPFAIFCAHPLRSVLPIMKLMHAAVVALIKTVKKPGSRPNKYPLEAASGMTGILTNSHMMYTCVCDKN